MFRGPVQAPPATLDSQNDKHLPPIGKYCSLESYKYASVCQTIQLRPSPPLSTHKQDGTSTRHHNLPTRQVSNSLEQMAYIKIYSITLCNY